MAFGKILARFWGAGGLPGWYEMTLKVFPGDCPPKNEHHHHHPLHLLSCSTVGLLVSHWKWVWGLRFGPVRYFLEGRRVIIRTDVF